MTNAVSLQYANSLFDLSIDLEKDLSDLEVIKSCISDSTELVKVLMHPSISKEEKKEIFKNLFENKVANYLLYFLYVLIDNERILELSNIYESFQMLVDEKYNMLRCHVISKHELTSNIKEDLIRYLENKYQMKILLTEQIDDTLIGGIKVMIRNEVIDYTFNYQLENMKNIIKG